MTIRPFLVLLAALLLVTGCGGADAPPGSADAALDGDPDTDAANVSADASTDATDAATGCACVAVGWVCGGVAASDPESCVHCGLWCPSTDGGDE